MGKIRVKTNATEGAARFTTLGDGEVERGPADDGNAFDIRMSEELDGVVAARKIAAVLKAKGVCLVEANAPHDLLAAAHDEAEELWGDGEFSRPLKVYDDVSMKQAQLWDLALSDEKVVWIKEGELKPRRPKNALKLLARNLADFGAGLEEGLSKELGIRYDRNSQAMLSCYSGGSQTHLHIDNPHACDPDAFSIPDCGMRLSASYYINPHWDPSEGSCEGGLDVHLSDPRKVPKSASAARHSSKLRVAPHADTLVFFLSERMAHQVLPTTGKERWFCMNMWFMSGEAMEAIPQRMDEIQMRKARRENPDDDD